MSGVVRLGFRTPMAAVCGAAFFFSGMGLMTEFAPRAAAAEAAGLTYPKARKSDQVDDYHGTQVADPYRWLEDPDSEETKAWVTAQQEVTAKYFADAPMRKEINDRLTELWNFERFGLPSERGGKYFYDRNDGLQNQSVIYVADSLDAEPRVLLDPNKLSDDGTVALSGTALSEDGKMLAYGLASSGSDWQEWKVRSVETGEDLTDHLQWIKFSGASWTPDGAGFYYSRYDEPNEETKFTDTNYFQKLYFHKIGTPQSEDVLVYDRPDQKEWGFHGEVTEDGKYLVISVTRGTERKNQVFYKDLTQADAKVVELLSGFDAKYEFVANDGSVLYIKTDLDAPRGRVVAIDLAKPESGNWKEIVPQVDEVLDSASVVGNQLFASYLKDAYSEVQVYDLTGKRLSEVKLPGIGTAGGFGGRRDQDETFYAYTSFIQPTTIYRYDLKTGQSTVYRAPKTPFDASKFETKQVFFQSKDGTRVPMFITAKKGIKLDGTNPTLLYAYGGFDISLTPSYSVTTTVWLELGGVYALPNLRGGGEYGREWHEGGMKEKKQNVFDDFIGAAEYLIDQKYTSPEKLAIFGGSNGGLLVGACMTQRPELYGACIPAVGVMDMLRFHKFTIGWAWVPEYGSSDDADAFKYLYAYSPLHNLKSGTQYPATMITTADHDDRVVPAHSFKYAATLQESQAGGEPTLIRIESKAGHGAGTPTSKRIELAADQLSFLAKELGVKPAK
jgi:prolyl oligopeptidase